MFSVLFTLFTFVFSPQIHAQTPEQVNQFVNQQLKPLLSGREKFYSIQIKRGAKPVVVLYSGSPQMWLGKYEITLTANNEVVEGAPELKTEWASYSGTVLQRMTGSVTLPVSGQGSAAKLRSLLRSDSLLHPMIAPPGILPRLAPIQEEIVSQLRQFYWEAVAKGEGMRALILAATGLGKTIMSGLFLNELAKNGEPFKIVFVVQNNEILADATLKFEQLIKINPRETKRLFGDNGLGSEKLFEGNTKLISMSRTKMHRNLKQLMEEREKFKGRVFYFFDEAHHLGKVDGEFNDILEEVNKRLHKGDVLLGGTATPWHTDSDIIERIFHNNVATALITPEEKQRFISERKLIYMARLMLFRAIAEGYLSPIQDYKHVRYLENEEVPVLARKFLMDWDLKFEGLDQNERYALMKKEITVHVPFIKTVIREIKAAIEHDANGKPLYMNRGIIFVPSIAHADVYAYLMNYYAPKGKDKIVAKAFHSGMKQDVRDAAMDWFRDEEKKEERLKRVDRQETKEKMHKYLVVIRTLGEGFDEPKVNHLVLAKPYSAEDEVGMRELLQNLGRGSRLSYAKRDFHISDFTGDMKRLIFQGLDQSLVKSFFVEGNENLLDDQPEPEEPQEERKITTEVVIDGKTMKEKNFDTTSVSVPAAQLAIGEPPQPLLSPAAPEAEIPNGTPEEKDGFAHRRAEGTEAEEQLKLLTWEELFAEPGSGLLIIKDHVYDEYKVKEKIRKEKLSLNDLKAIAKKSPAGMNEVDFQIQKIAIERLIYRDITRLAAYKGYDASGKLSPINKAMIDSQQFMHSGMGDTMRIYLQHAFEKYQEIFSGEAFDDPMDKEEMRRMPRPKLAPTEFEVAAMKRLGVHSPEELPPEFKRMTWDEFLSEPGSSRFIFHTTEQSLKNVAMENQYSIRDLMLMSQDKWTGPWKFTPAQVAVFAERIQPRRVRLQNLPFFRGYDRAEILSPFMKAHFLPTEFSLRANTVAELFSREEFDTPYIKANVNMTPAMKNLFRPMSWRSFIHRPGSAFFLFDRMEFQHINIAAEQQFSIYDIQSMHDQSSKWLLYPDEVWAELKARIARSRIPRKIDSISDFTPAHFLFVPYNFLGREFLSHQTIFDVVNEHVDNHKLYDFISSAVMDVVPEIPASVRRYRGDYHSDSWSELTDTVRSAAIKGDFKRRPLVRDIQRIAVPKYDMFDPNERWTWARLLTHPAGLHAFAAKHPNLRQQVDKLFTNRESLLEMAIRELEVIPDYGDMPARQRALMNDGSERNMLRQRVREDLKALNIQLPAGNPELQALAAENTRLLRQRPASARIAEGLLAEFQEQERKLIELVPELRKISPITSAGIMQKSLPPQGYLAPIMPDGQILSRDFATYFKRRRTYEIFLATRGVQPEGDYLLNMLEIQFAVLGLPKTFDYNTVVYLEGDKDWNSSCEDLVANRKMPAGLGEATGADFVNEDEPQPPRPKRRGPSYLKSPRRI